MLSNPISCLCQPSLHFALPLYYEIGMSSLAIPFFLGHNALIMRTARIMC